MAQELVNGHLDDLIPTLNPLYQEALQEWKTHLTECPKLAREAGAVEVERRAYVDGIAYDHTLVPDGDLESFIDFSQRTEEVEVDWQARCERLLRFAERHRAHEQWPLDLEDLLLKLIGRTSYPSKLAELEPGSKEFMKMLRNFKTQQPEAYEASEWAEWHREWRRSRGIST